MLFDNATWWLAVLLLGVLMALAEYLLKRSLFGRIDEMAAKIQNIDSNMVKKADYDKAHDKALKDIEQIKKDYTKYMFFSYGDIQIDNWLREAAVFPDRLCDRVIQKKEEIKEKLDSTDKVIIYGAGVHGEHVMRGLYGEGYYEKICCFAVSENPPSKLIAKKQVLRIEEALTEYPGALVVVAAARDGKAYMQMLAKLEQLEVWEYLDGNDIEENFYIA